MQHFPAIWYFCRSTNFTLFLDIEFGLFWLIKYFRDSKMKAVVIYFLVLLVHLFGGFADSYSIAHSPQAGDSYKHNAAKAISVMESVFQSKAETQDVADYLIYVEDEDDERSISKKIPAVADCIFTCSGISVLPHFLKVDFSSVNHLSQTGSHKYLAHRALRI
jgi:hypothetical protein